MAPKHSAPPPPAASSEETNSSSESYESEEEVAPASPVLTSKNSPRAAPPKKGVESESSEEEEGEEEEDEVEATQANPSSAPAPKKAPPPRKVEESDSSGEDEDEEGESSESEPDKAPPPKPAPKQAEEEKHEKPSLTEGGKKPVVPFQRAWSTDDEVRILEALAAHLREHGALPQIDALSAALAGKLDNCNYGPIELKSKLQTMKSRYGKFVKKGELPSKDHDRRIFNLCKSVWGTDKPAGNSVAKADGGAPRGFSEMCELYPYLAEEVNVFEAMMPGMFKRQFAMIDDEKARAMDVNIKKLRLERVRVELRSIDLTKEVTKTLMDLIQ